jgi:hypothetical protein
MKKQLFLYLFIVPLMFSCGGDSANPIVSQDQILGAWIQESANDFILVTNDRYLTLTFREDATFEIIVVTGRGSGNPITETIQGTYILSGIQLTTTFQDGLSSTVTIKIEGDRMIFEDATGNVSVYRR